MHGLCYQPLKRLSVLVPVLLVLVVCGLCGPCKKEGVIDWILERFRERCTKKWIKNDLLGLEHKLNTKLHGQHLATKMIATSIRGHLLNENPSKALLLSFHGGSGIGKTYASEIIASSLYKSGMHSKFVKRFYGQTDFPDSRMVDQYKKRVRESIYDCVKRCCQCLFIFEEIDTMLPGIFDSFRGYFDHYSSIQGLNFRKGIFIFISNIGASKLVEVMMSHLRSGFHRERLELMDIEPYLKNAVYNVDGGLQYSALIQHNLLGTFVPFLPLEKDHIKQCIEDLAGHRQFNENKLNTVANSLSYFPDDLQLFAKTGCTSVQEKLYQHDEL